MTTRPNALPVLALLGALTSACTTISPQPASTLPVYLGLRPVETTREFVDRYSCGSTTPLYCTCDSRMRSSPCRCQCPTY